jgi:hypothetical protein
VALASVTSPARQLLPALLRGELPRVGVQGLGPRPALRRWLDLRYLVTEEPGRGCRGGRGEPRPGPQSDHAVVDVHGTS